MVYVDHIIIVILLSKLVSVIYYLFCSSLFFHSFINLFISYFFIRLLIYLFIFLFIQLVNYLFLHKYLFIICAFVFYYLFI